MRQTVPDLIRELRREASRQTPCHTRDLLEQAADAIAALTRDEIEPIHSRGPDLPPGLW